MWYAFRVQSQKEFATVNVLRRRGVNATVPFEVKFLRRTQSRKKAVQKPYPLLVGYVLADLPSADYVGEVMRLSHLVKSVVGFNGYPASLNASQVERMLAQSGQQIPNRQSVNTRRSLAKGDTATLTGHGFSNYPVRVEAIKGERALIMLELFGTSREVAVRLDQLEAA